MRIPQKPRWTMWDHNIHYHRFLLEQVPLRAGRALDVGCGAGLFAERLDATVPEVLAIDRDPGFLRTASELSTSANVRYVAADLMEAELPFGSFDFVSCLSALHHMPLRPALQRLRSLLAPGGVLAVLGLYRCTTPFDYIYVGTTALIDLGVGLVRHRTQGPVRRSQGVVQNWDDALGEIRRAAQSVLPGAVIRRHMYDRYSLIYREPWSDPSRTRSAVCSDALHLTPAKDGARQDQ